MRACPRASRCDNPSLRAPPARVEPARFAPRGRATRALDFRFAPSAPPARVELARFAPRGCAPRAPDFRFAPSAPPARVELARFAPRGRAARAPAPARDGLACLALRLAAVASGLWARVDPARSMDCGATVLRALFSDIRDARSERRAALSARTRSAKPPCVTQNGDCRAPAMALGPNACVRVLLQTVATGVANSSPGSEPSSPMLSNSSSCSSSRSVCDSPSRYERALPTVPIIRATSSTRECTPNLE